ncbi:MAG TPA: hypothetical protein VFQ76_08450 [Longimicrobiaceae bacterium]|nr:hypothetical protein [Longimicrobiaceae bacterium]
MTETAQGPLRANWRCEAGVWVAEATPCDLRVEVGDEFWHWTVEVGQVEDSGKADDREAAQFAAEAAALQWLSEGVSALGGRVLTSEEAGLVVEALDEAEFSDRFYAPDRDTCLRMQALARKLEADRG